MAPDYIYQAYFENDGLAGYSDFLEKIPQKSALGKHSYEVIDTKLARRASAGNAVQLIHYSELVAGIQKRECKNLHLVHGDGRRNTLQREDYIYYYHELVKDFKRFISEGEETKPFPVNYCSSCRYSDICHSYWEENDDISQVSYLTQSSMVKLEGMGIDTMKSLIEKAWKEEEALISKSKFIDLQKQAKAQKFHEILLRNKVALQKLAITAQNSICLTFFRHIQPVNGAFTFFMGMQTSQGRFECLNITDSDAEKAGFKRITEFFMRFLDHFPNTVVYTFSQADLTLVHDLSNRYNICHDDVDDLIYKQKLIALQPAIRQSLTVPVGRYGVMEMLEVLDPSLAADNALAKSPQILYDLYESDGIENGLELINNRGKLELEAMHSLLRSAGNLVNAEFPVKVEQETAL